MAMILNTFLPIWIKIFFLLTPFFVLSMFLAMTQDKNESQRRIVAVKTTCAVAVICLILYFLGNPIFRLFGVTLDAFRIGAGALLFMSALKLVNGQEDSVAKKAEGDITVVPLAIPITIGPATTGTLLVMGAENNTAVQHLVGCNAILAAVFCVGIILFIGASIEKVLHKQGIGILSKLTGLMLAAMAAQLIMTGVKSFLG